MANDDKLKLPPWPELDVPATPTATTGDKKRAEAFKRAAARLKLKDPADLAAIVSFESAGSFDPHKIGGEGNRYRGLIQFGPEEQKKYYRPGQSFEDQLEDGVVRFFEDRFKQAGMSTADATLEDLYTTVIAGNPKANRNVKDAFGTSAKSGAARIAKEHKPKVLQNIFGGITPVAASAIDNPFENDDDILSWNAPNIGSNTPVTASTPDNPFENDDEILSWNPQQVLTPQVPATIPETPITLEAQTASTRDIASPRVATLFTDEDQLRSVSSDLLNGLFRVDTPNGILMINPRKAKQKGITDIPAYVAQKGFADLIGKAVNVGNNTASGMVVVTKDALGNELSSSVVHGPDSAKRQAEIDRASFPNAAHQEVVSAQDAAAQRQAAQQQLQIQTLGGVTPEMSFPEPSGEPATVAAQPEMEQLQWEGKIDDDYAEYVKYAQQNKLPIMSKQQFIVDVVSKAGQGEAQATGYQTQPNVPAQQERPQQKQQAQRQTRSGETASISRQRQVGQPTSDLNRVVIAYTVPKSITTEEDALRQALRATGELTPNEINRFIANRKRDGIKLLTRPLSERIRTIQVPYYVIAEAKGDASRVEGDIAMEQAQTPVGTAISQKKYGRLPETQAEQAIDKRIREKDYVVFQKLTEALQAPWMLMSPTAGVKFASDPSDEWLQAEKKRLKEQYGSYANAYDAEQYYQNTTGLEKTVRTFNQGARSFLKNLVGGTAKTAVFLSQLQEDNDPINQLLPDNAKIGLRNAGNIADFISRLVTSGSASTAYKEMDWVKSLDGIDRQQFFKAIQEFDKAVGDDPVLKGRFLGSLGDAGGSAASFIALGTMMPSLVTTNFWGTTRNWGQAVSGIAQMAGSGYEEGKRSGLDEATARKYGLIQGALGVTEMLGAGAELAQFLKSPGLRRQMAQALVEVGKATLREGKQEFAQEVFQTTAGKAVMEYLKDNDESTWRKLYNAVNRLPKQLSESIANEGIIAMITGGVMGGGGRALQLATQSADTTVDARSVNEIPASDGSTTVVTSSQQPQIFTDKQGRRFEVIEDLGDKVRVRNERGGEQIRNKSGLTEVNEKTPDVSKPTALVDAEPLVQDQAVEVSTKSENIDTKSPNVDAVNIRPTLTGEAKKPVESKKQIRYREDMPSGLVDEAPLQPETLEGAKNRLKEVETELQEERRKGTTDAKMGISNERAWQAAVDRIEADPNQEVVSLDINRMKEANDTTSHTGIDKNVLAPIGAAVRKVLKANGIDERNAFRTGGDEVVVAVSKGLGAKIRDEIEKEVGVIEIVAEKDFTNDRTGESFKKGDVIPVTLSGEIGLTVAEAEKGLGARKRASKDANPVRRVEAKAAFSEPVRVGGLSSVLIKPDDFNALPTAKQQRVQELIAEAKKLNVQVPGIDLGPDQVRRMSNRQKDTTNKGIIRRNEIVDEIRQLLKTDEQVSSETREADIKKAQSRLNQIDAYVQRIEGLGRMSHNAKGQLKPKYQRSIDIQNKEREQLLNDYPELRTSPARPAASEADVAQKDAPPLASLPIGELRKRASEAGIDPKQNKAKLIKALEAKGEKAATESMKAPQSEGESLKMAAGENVLDSVYDGNGVNYEQVKDVAGRVESGELEIVRLDPAGERGRIAGGKRTLEASVLLGADEASRQKASSRSGADVEPRGESRARQEKLLENYAKREGIWYDWNRFFKDKHFTRGGEAFVYHQSDTHVAKTVDYRHIDKSLTPQQFIDNRIALFNEIFPGAKYELMGFTKDPDGKFRFLVKQQFFDAHGLSKADVDAYMRGKGFEPTGRESYANEIYQVHDVHEKNALKDEEGRVYVIDAVPKPNYEVEPLEIVEPESLKMAAGEKPTETDSVNSLPVQPRSEFKVKPPKRLYRGIMKSGEGAKTASLGRGLYSTRDKAWLKRNFKFDDVITLTPEEAYPRNPLVIREPSAFADWLLEESGFDNMREFGKTYPDPAEFVRSKGFDGVDAGQEVVRYFDPNEDSILKMTADDSNLERFRDYGYAHTQTVLEDAKSEIKDVDGQAVLELNEAGAELARRVEASATGKKVSQFYGSTYTTKQLKKLAQTAKEWADRYEEKGYTADQVKSMRDLVANLETLAEKDGAGVVYIFDFALPHETHHKLVLDALGGKAFPKKTIAKLEALDIWNANPTITTPDGKSKSFNSAYPRLSKEHKAIEMAAMLETGEINHSDKNRFLDIFARGILKVTTELDPVKFARILSFRRRPNVLRLSAPAPLFSGGDIEFPSHGINNMRGALKFLRDIAATETFKKHGLRRFNIATNRSVVSSVIRSIQDLKIRDAVVQFIPVDVVDNLVSVEPAANVLLHDPSVFESLLTIDLNGAITIRSDVAAILVKGIAAAGTKGGLRLDQISSLAEEFNTAIGADTLNRGASRAMGAPMEAIPSTIDSSRSGGERDVASGADQTQHIRSIPQDYANTQASDTQRDRTEQTDREPDERSDGAASTKGEANGERTDDPRTGERASGRTADDTKSKDEKGQRVDSGFTPGGREKTSKTPSTLRERGGIPVEDRPYTSTTNAERIAFANQILDRGIDDAREWLDTQIEDDNNNAGATAIVGIALMNTLGKSGRTSELNEVADALLPMVTDAAQTVQAISIVSMFSPDTAIPYATKAAKQAGKDITPEQAKRAGDIAKRMNETVQALGLAQNSLKAAETYNKELNKQIKELEDALNLSNTKLGEFKLKLMGQGRTIAALRRQVAGIVRPSRTRTSKEVKEKLDKIASRKDEIIANLKAKFGTPAVFRMVADVEIAEVFRMAADDTLDQDLLDYATLTLADSIGTVTPEEFKRGINVIANGQLTADELDQIHAYAVNEIHTTKSEQSETIKERARLRRAHYTAAKQYQLAQLDFKGFGVKTEAEKRLAEAIIAAGEEGQFSDEAIWHAFARLNYPTVAEQIRAFREEFGKMPNEKDILADSERVLIAARSAIRKAQMLKKDDTLEDEDIELIKEQNRVLNREKGAVAREASNFYGGLVRTKGEITLNTVVDMRRANLLSAIKTHLVNLFGNTGFAMSEEIAKLPATTIDQIAAIFTDQRAVALTPKGIASGLKVLLSKDETLANSDWDSPGGRERAITAAKHILTIGGSLADMERHQYSESILREAYPDKKLAKWVDNYINYSFRLLGAEDALFKTYAFRRYIEEAAKVQAFNEKRNDPSLDVNKRRKELTLNPTNAMQVMADDYAHLMTFQNDNPLSGFIAQVKRNRPKVKAAIETIVPYDRTPTNIVIRTLEYSPLGVPMAIYQLVGKEPSKEFRNQFTSPIREDVAPNTTPKELTKEQRKAIEREINRLWSQIKQAEFARVMGRATVGTSLFGVGMTLAALGLMAGAMGYDDDDPRERDLAWERRKQGVEPGSILLPFLGIRIQLPVSPASSALTAGATFYEQIKMAKKDTTLAVVDGAKETFADMAAKQPYINATTALLRDLRKQRYGEFTGNLLSGYVPASAMVRSISEVTDEKERTGSGYRKGEKINTTERFFKRQWRGFRNSLFKGVPGARNYWVDESTSGVSPEVRGGPFRRVIRNLDPFNTRPGVDAPVPEGQVPDNKSYFNSSEFKRATTDDIVTMIYYDRESEIDTTELEQALRKKVMNARKAGTFTAEEAKRVNDILGTNYAPRDTRKK